MSILLIPPIAFVLYIVLVGALSGLGKLIAEPHRPNAAKTSAYTGGETLPLKSGVPGYRPFFRGWPSFLPYCTWASSCWAAPWPRLSPFSTWRA